MPSTNQANKKSLSCSLLSCLCEQRYSTCLLIKSIFPLQKILDTPVLGRWKGGAMSLQTILHWAQSFRVIYSKYSSQLNPYVLSVKVYVWDLQIYPQKRKLYFHVEQEEQVIWVRILKSAMTFNLKLFAYKIINQRHF